MTEEDKLFDSYENYRFFIYKQLADLSEEQGEIYHAAGYRWLAEFKRVPYEGSRLTKNTWSWRFVECHNLKYLKSKKANCLPKQLYDLDLMNTSPFYSAKDALRSAAEAIGIWLKKER